MTSTATEDQADVPERVPSGCPVVHLDASPPLEVGSHWRTAGELRADHENAVAAADVDLHGAEAKGGVLGHRSEEAIRLANNTPYGLAAYVFTESVTQGTLLTEALEYGIIGWNDGVPSAAQAPFGGMKESGIGREGGTEGIEAFLETKYVSIGL
jgi:hypothetical protein